jgi:hypothetical protein
MRFKCFVCLLLASLAWSQAAPPAAPPAAGAKPEPSSAPAPDKAPEVKVGPDDTVLTLKGFCPNTSKTGDDCKTAITRAQFEKLGDALQPNMSPAIRRQLATRYGMVLQMSTEAEKRGLDKQPVFEEKMYWARMNILTQELSATLQTESANVSDTDVEEYYKKNAASYETAVFMRIIVPRTKQFPLAVTSTKAGATKAGTTTAAKPNAPPPAPTEAQKKAAEEAMTKLADTLRARAVKGEDADKLQKEAYVAAGLKGNTPNTKIENVRRSTLPTNHQSVMDLKPGEVSEVISDPSAGHYIYVMISKETIPLDKAAPEIRKTISNQRYREAMQSFQKDVELNDAYFGPARGPMMPPVPRGPKPPAEHAADPD